jgi:hypothetical protein
MPKYAMSKSQEKFMDLPFELQKKFMDLPSESQKKLMELPSELRKRLLQLDPATLKKFIQLPTKQLQAMQTTIMTILEPSKNEFESITIAITANTSIGSGSSYPSSNYDDSHNDINPSSDYDDSHNDIHPK